MDVIIVVIKNLLLLADIGYVSQMHHLKPTRDESNVYESKKLKVLSIWI